MSIIDFATSFYCLYFKNNKGEKQMFLQPDITPSSSRYQLHLFESKETLFGWIKQEQKIQALNEWRGIHKFYDRLYPKKIYITEFSTLMKENEEIDSVTVVAKNGVRRLYFRDDLTPDFNTFPISSKKLHSKEPIYIINRQKKLDKKIVLQKESYFVTYPEIATPLFSIEILEWAEDLISRKPNQGYYIEQTTLYDIYMRTTLEEKDPGFFILSKEEAPHYILRKKDLKRIVEGRWNNH
ncbi:hypothetical protein GND95_10590 [Defluviitalea raffinosedens]|jgi:hypothetical protein|uniref:Uncharacterized protein n=1 Tax=Defluviitalea raffinosedens TaxID=1450156 RepID=A0A7C8LIP7_9FIRM|nr:hypothetical protein [Defluviitalea raffinosedens]KAE9632958.1 hypothetical protein GND95_10590 [Defluviitalea raffinosedens]